MLRDVVVDNPTIPAAPIDITATTEEGQEVTLAKVNLDDVRQIASFTEPNPITTNGEQTAVFPLGVREYKFTVNVPASQLTMDCTSFLCLDSENATVSAPVLPSEFTYVSSDHQFMLQPGGILIVINTFAAGWIIRYDARLTTAAQVSQVVPAGSWYFTTVPSYSPGVTRLPFLFCNDSQGRLIAGIYDPDTHVNATNAYAMIPTTYMTISTLPNSPT